MTVDNATPLHYWRFTQKQTHVCLHPFIFSHTLDLKIVTQTCVGPLKTSAETHLAQSAGFHWIEGLAGPCWSKHHHIGPTKTAGTAE